MSAPAFIDRAALLKKLHQERDDYVSEHFMTDPETGALEGGRACGEYLESLDEWIEAIEAFPTIGDTITYRTPDHPEANGRKPQEGDRAYPLTFPSEDGCVVQVLMGEVGFQKLTDLLMDMLSEAPSHDDGSLARFSDTALLHAVMRNSWELVPRHGLWNVLRNEGMMQTGITAHSDLRAAIIQAINQEGK